MKRLIQFLFSLAFLSESIFAGWPCSSSVSVSLSTNSGMQWNARFASDGVFGAYVVWQDRRGGPTDKLYIQHLNVSGNNLWQAGGIVVSNSSGYQVNAQIVSDGAGGAIVVWQDNRNTDYDIFAQRISSNGTLLWTSAGMPVCSVTGYQYNPKAASDGFGGVVVAWQDHRDSTWDVYAQRLNGNGDALWQTNGLPVVNALGNQLKPDIAGDGKGGAIVAWEDTPPGSFTDIRAQRLLSDGNKAWDSNGTPVCVASKKQVNVQIVADGSQGMVACWEDYRNNLKQNIYAQRIDSNGTAGWQADGVPLSVTGTTQSEPRLSGDGFNGAVVTWQDKRGLDPTWNIYTQRIDGNGSLVWGTDGIALCDTAGDQMYPQIVGDAGNATIVWQDYRTPAKKDDIYIQRVNNSGIPQWGTSGVAVFSDIEEQISPQIVGDGAHGVITAWVDLRAGGGSTDLYAQRFGANGKAGGGCYRSFTQDSLSEKGRRIIINKRLPYNMPNAGNVRDTVFGRGGFPRGLFLGVERRDSAKAYGWIVLKRTLNVRTVLPETGIAHQFGTISNRAFVGVVSNPNIRLINNRLVGELIALKISIAASDLGITEPRFGDLVYYDISNPNNPLNNRSLRNVGRFVDTVLSMWRWYQGKGIDYQKLASTLRTITTAFDGAIDTERTKPLRIKAVKPLSDVSFLLPNPEIEAGIPSFTPDPFAGIDEELPAKYNLSQNYPNPFNPLTTITFNLDEPAFVTLKVYNLLGQEVATILDHADMEEGSQQVHFDGSALASGVYFYRLIGESAGDGNVFITPTHKMVLLK